MTTLKIFKCSFPFRNISIPGSEPSVARELRSNSFPHFSSSSAQLHDVWLGGASVLGSHLAGEPSAGAYVFALRNRSISSLLPSPRLGPAAAPFAVVTPVPAFPNS